MARPQSTTSSRQHQPVCLARRLLFPHLHPSVDLPPLFHSEACPPELHEETYDLVALALRAFVNTWWTKLTRYDKELLPQITAVVTHVVRSLEHRLLHADLSLLLFSDMPAIVTQHYKDYRQALAKTSTSYANGGALSLPQLFHQLQPHMAVSPDGSLDEEYFRQAIDHVLRECLPTEDYAPEAERFIVREILLKVVVKDVIPRITQPWFLQKMVLDILGPSPDMSEQVCHSILLSTLRSTSYKPSVASASVRGLSKSSIIVHLLSTIQKLSGMCIMLIHAYKQAIHIIPIVNQTTCSQTHVASDEHVSGTPPASPTSSTTSTPASTPECTRVVFPPDLACGLLAMISEVLCVQNRLAAAALIQLAYLVCYSFQTFINKLLCYLLYSYVLSASTTLSVVRLSKRSLFPNGYPGPPPVDPTPEEQVVIRDELVKRIGERIPTLARSVLLGDPAVPTLDGVVDALSNEACNRHLVVVVVDALLLSLFPEMGS